MIARTAHVLYRQYISTSVLFFLLVTVLQTFSYVGQPMLTSTAVQTNMSEHPKKRKRTHRRRPKPREHKKTLKEMDYQELEEAKKRVLAEGNQESALKFIKQMFTLVPDVTQLCTLTLEYADLLFDTGALEQSLAYYSQFLLRYPGDKHVEYVSYRVVLCTYYASCDAERDQTKTEDTIKCANEFLAREIFTQYRDEVEKMRYACYQKIIMSELNICSFYLKRDRLHAAQIRIDNLRTQWVHKVPQLEVQLSLLETELQIKQHIANGTLSAQEGKHQLKKHMLTQHQPEPDPRPWKNRF